MGETVLKDVPSIQVHPSAAFGQYQSSTADRFTQLHKYSKDQRHRNRPVGSEDSRPYHVALLTRRGHGMQLSHSMRTLATATWVSLATLVPAVAWPADDLWSSPEAWLCLPGRSDLCAGPIQRMTIDAEGKVTRDAVAANSEAPVDCFYVYPTISTDPAGNSSLTPVS